MLNILNVLDASKQSREVVLMGRHGRRLTLRSTLPISPGTSAELKLHGELLLGEVVASVGRIDHYDIEMQVREVVHDSWHPKPEWSGMDSDESVMTSLIALGSRLQFYADQQRGHANRMRSDSTEATGN